MRCYICGKNNAYVDYKRGKGKISIKKAVVGGLLTAPVGGMGVAAGFTDLVAQKGYCVCPDCGYNQFQAFVPSNVMEPSRMTQINMYFDDYGISYYEFVDTMTRYAKISSVPMSLRFAEVSANSINGPETVPCIVVEHPAHQKDYFRYCIVPENANFSGDARFSVWLCGKSSQMDKSDYIKNKTEFSASGLDLAGLGMLRGGAYGVGFAIGAMGTELARCAGTGAKKLYNSLTLDKAALNQEILWYDEIELIIKSTFA